MFMVTLHKPSLFECHISSSLAISIHVWCKSSNCSATSDGGIELHTGMKASECTGKLHVGCRDGFWFWFWIIKRVMIPELLTRFRWGKWRTVSCCIRLLRWFTKGFVDQGWHFLVAEAFHGVNQLFTRYPMMSFLSHEKWPNIRHSHDPSVDGWVMTNEVAHFSLGALGWRRKSPSHNGWRIISETRQRTSQLGGMQKKCTSPEEGKS